MLNMVEVDRINIFSPAIPCVMGTMYVQVKSMIFFTSTRWGRHCWSAQTCHWKRSCFDSDSNMSLNVSYAVVLAMFFDVVAIALIYKVCLICYMPTFQKLLND